MHKTDRQGQNGTERALKKSPNRASMAGVGVAEKNDDNLKGNYDLSL